MIEIEIMISKMGWESVGRERKRSDKVDKGIGGRNVLYASHLPTTVRIIQSNYHHVFLRKGKEDGTPKSGGVLRQ
jgi:hypothetical protein